MRFDTNAFTVPPWTIGQKLTVKADASTVSVYHKHKKWPATGAAGRA